MTKIDCLLWWYHLLRQVRRWWWWWWWWCGMNNHQLREAGEFCFVRRLERFPLTRMGGFSARCPVFRGVKGEWTSKRSEFGSRMDECTVEYSTALYCTVTERLIAGRIQPVRVGGGWVNRRHPQTIVGWSRKKKGWAASLNRVVLGICVGFDRSSWGFLVALALSCLLGFPY